MLFKYLKQQFLSILIFIVFCAIFSAVFYLYGMPFNAILYPILLCSAIGIVTLAVDFIRVYSKHKALERAASITSELPGSLPMPSSVQEEDYRMLISLLSDEQKKCFLRSEERFSDMIEYYTVWAHQIKTPISSMRLQLQNEDTLMSRTLSSELNHIEQYVEMVLTFLRLDSDATDYVFRKYDLDEIIKQAVKKFSGEFIARRISLDFHPTGSNIVTDEKWLLFIIEQVLSNALKYTKSGCITIKAENRILQISDTGIGIAPEDLPRIFEKGYTGFNGRKDKKASGIGLYLCKRICGNLGIAISAESVLGHGTVIKLKLPDEK